MPWSQLGCASIRGLNIEQYDQEHLPQLLDFDHSLSQRISNLLSNPIHQTSSDSFDPQQINQLLLRAIDHQFYSINTPIYELVEYLMVFITFSLESDKNFCIRLVEDKKYRNLLLRIILLSNYQNYSYLRLWSSTIFVWLSFHIDKNHLKEIVLPKSFFLDTFQPHIKQQPSQINALMKIINNPEPNNDTSEHLINQWSNQRETQNFLLFKVFSESLAYEGDDGVQLAILKALRNIVVQLVIAIDIENAENREQTNDSRSDSAILLELKSLDSTIKENLEEEGNYEDLERLEFNPEKQIKEVTNLFFINLNER
ncbi:MAG: hypothetical protein EZS28_029967 [Streblomastix strix]|uniref:Uncharacterized protein n=1 Tax=Streblomastix strix TaxID=222440 RepID=A0A5J4UW31_9EUKA|nr:MAG: hypothetical protein EZS28_029967 [Streblomastix strix]